jgi:hypothetical protein
MAKLVTVPVCHMGVTSSSEYSSPTTACASEANITLEGYTLTR